MNESGYVKAFTTYDKQSAVSIISALRSEGLKMIYRTTTEPASDDVLYEIDALEKDIDRVHEIILNINDSVKGESR
ncbi:MAG: hypothetical protein JXB33_07150 [Clostridia bacterium]|nr:hypothetical protein [Clostridia bacterium]